MRLHRARQIERVGERDARIRPGDCLEDETLEISQPDALSPLGELPRPWGRATVRPTEVPLAEIVDKGPNILELSGRTVDDLWGFCRTCCYAETCLGGGPWTAHTYLGRPGNNPFCVHRARELARQGRRERVVPVQSAPGERFDHGLWEIVEESAG